MIWLNIPFSPHKLNMRPPPPHSRNRFAGWSHYDRAMVSKRGKFLHRHPRPPVREEISNANGHVDIGDDQPFGEAMGSEAQFLMSNPFGKSSFSCPDPSGWAAASVERFATPRTG
jgi:hypothetical protein